MGRRPLADGLGARIRIADLFAGCGGMTIGIVEATRTVARPVLTMPRPESADGPPGAVPLIGIYISTYVDIY